MEKIIEQIIKIDTEAFENKAKSEEKLKAKRTYYEEELKNYKKDKIKEATAYSQNVYEQMLEIGKKSYELEMEKAKQSILKLEKKYLEVEPKLLEEVFNELFIME